MLLVAALEQLLCNTKVTDVARLAAYVKRMAGLACHGASPAEALGCLAVTYRTVRRYPRCVGRGVGGGDCLGPAGSTLLRAFEWCLWLWYCVIVTAGWLQRLVCLAGCLTGCLAGCIGVPASGWHLHRVQACSHVVVASIFTNRTTCQHSAVPATPSARCSAHSTLPGLCSKSYTCWLAAAADAPPPAPLLQAAAHAGVGG